MEALSKDILRFKEKPWLISMICAIFVAYPNIAWFHCDLTITYCDEQLPFTLFSLFRIAAFWSILYVMVRHNLRRLSNASFIKRFAWNAVAGFVAFLLYEAITLTLTSYAHKTSISILIFQFIVLVLLATFSCHIIMLYIIQREKDNEIEQLRIENLQSRCDALTNQINPHFFFNALNGVSALVRRKDEASTLLYVNRLSDIFRYILQSEKKGMVTLEEEINFAEAYSHVMEVRYANKFFVAINVPAEKRQLRLPVLSLLPLIENTTVHNAIDSESPMHVSIYLNEHDELVVSNPICPKLTPPVTHGTGLNNLSNRFMLLTKQTVRISNDGETFTVYLPLIG